MTNYRHLCIELLDCLEKADWPVRYRALCLQWIDIAHASLVEPNPSSPADWELSHLMHDFVFGGESESDFSFDHLGYARAVLERWGQ